MWTQPKGYAHEDSGWVQTAAFWGCFAALFALKFLFLFWTGAVLLTMLVFYGGGFLALISYEAWKRQLPSPKLTIPSTLKQGEPLTIDLTFNADAVELVEVVATRKRSHRNSDGGTSTNHHRVVARQLSDQTDATSDQLTFVGRVPESQSFVVKWFIAVHIRHNRVLKYVRAYPVKIERAATRPRD